MQTETFATVKGVRFGVFSAEDIKKQSVVELNCVNPFDGNLPRPGSIHDVRQGSGGDRRLRCGTCFNTMDVCPGHYSHITFEDSPLQHEAFINTNLKTLKMCCFWCSRPLADTNSVKVRRAIEAQTEGEKRFQIMNELCKNIKVCPHEGCEGPQPIYKREKLNITLKWKDTALALLTDPEELAFATKPFTALDVFSILANISDEDATFMGFRTQSCRPENMMISALLVTPPAIRPSIMAAEGSKARGDDDISTGYRDTVKKKFDLKDKILANGASHKDSVKAFDDLQATVACIMNNDIKGVAPATKRSGQPKKDLTSRLKGKEGRFRGTLSGKRVNFSARTVIGPDPLMDTHCVVVPKCFAFDLTIPETVNALNLKQLQERVKKGAKDIRGAKTVIDLNGNKISLEVLADTSTIVLEYGYKVERFLQDGDWVLMNRQPSLHKGSMCGHKVILGDEKIFKIPLTICASYNGDFDGDEMNMHVAQSIEARVETEHIMAVPYQVISPQSNKPIQGIVQDTLLGSFLMTQKDCFFTQADAMNLVMGIKYVYDRSEMPPNGSSSKPKEGGWVQLPPPSILKPKKLWTGKQLFSLLFPKELQLEKTVRGLDAPLSSEEKNDEEVHVQEIDLDLQERSIVIRDGELIAGRLCKETLGAVSNGIIHQLYKYVGEWSATHFMSDCHRLVIEYITLRGFSFSIEDCAASEETEKIIDSIVDCAEAKVAEIIKEAKELGVGMDEMEATINSHIRKVYELSGGVVQNSLKDDNHMNTIITCASKGSMVNATQIHGSVGQNRLEGQRLNSSDGSRIIPSMRRNACSLASRGFVRSSYGKGLCPEESFLHAVGGREGLVDTAVKTSTTGYIERRLVKAMECISIKYDRTVRMANDSIVQFFYGGDGYDPTQIQKDKLAFLEWDDAKMIKEFGGGVQKFDDVESTHFYSSLKKEMEVLKQLRDEGRRRKVGVMTPKLDTSILVPCSVDTLITSAKRRFMVDRATNQEVNRVEVEVNRKVQEIDSEEKENNYEDLVMDLETYQAIMTNTLTSIVQHSVSGNVNFASGTPFSDLLVDEMECHSFNFVSLIRSKLSIAQTLLKHKLTKRAFTWICEKLVFYHQKSLVQAGESVGPIAASSISHPVTQMTLNTFHHIGGSQINATGGVPRIKELIDCTEKIKTPITRLPLTDNLSTADTAAMIEKTLEHRVLQDFVSSYEILNDPAINDYDFEEDGTEGAGRRSRNVSSSSSSFDTKSVSSSDTEILSLAQPFLARPQGLSDFVIRIVLDKTKMMDYNIEPFDISKLLHGYLGTQFGTVVCSESMDQEWVIRIRLAQIQTRINEMAATDAGVKKKAATKKQKVQAAAAGADPSSSTTSTASSSILSSREMEDIEKMVVRKIQIALFNEISVTGLKGVHKAVASKIKMSTFDPETGAHKLKDQWVIDTQGHALDSSVFLHSVAAERATSNDILEVFNKFGIEIAAATLFYEIKDVLTRSGTYVDDRHIKLVVDTITFQGYLMSMNRFGINRSDNTGPLVRASFEETLDVITEAAIFGHKDNLTGVTEHIIFGKLAPVGTGVMDVFNQPDYEAKLLSMRKKLAEPKIIFTDVTECLQTLVNKSKNILHEDAWMNDEKFLAKMETAVASSTSTTDPFTKFKLRYPGWDQPSTTTSSSSNPSKFTAFSSQIALTDSEADLQRMEDWNKYHSSLRKIDDDDDIPLGGNGGNSFLKRKRSRFGEHEEKDPEEVRLWKKNKTGFCPSSPNIHGSVEGGGGVPVRVFRPSSPWMEIEEDNEDVKMETTTTTKAVQGGAREQEESPQKAREVPLDYYSSSTVPRANDFSSLSSATTNGFYDSFGNPDMIKILQRKFLS